MSSKGLEPLKRPLTLHEQELVRWLIDHGTYTDKEHLRSQMDSLNVFEKCTCGCPTVYFSFKGVRVPRRGERLVSDYLAYVGGDEVGVMLFETDGLLGTLEVYSLAGHDKPFRLPEISSLHPLG